MTAALEARDMVAGYGDLRVLRGLSFSVEPGEFVGITGRNGVGKSTAMLTVAGLLRLQSGSVMLNGVNRGASSPWRRARSGLCLVPEGKRVMHAMSVLENLRLGSFGAGRRARGEEARRVESVLKLFPALASRLTENAGHLSGGQQQMLAVAQGLMSDPSVIIVDEPSSGLAPMLVDELLAGLRKLTATGVAVVVVEQQVDRIVRHSDSIVVVESGQVAWNGAAATSGIREIVEGIVLGTRRVRAETGI